MNLFKSSTSNTALKNAKVLFRVYIERLIVYGRISRLLLLLLMVGEEVIVVYVVDVISGGKQVIRNVHDWLRMKLESSDSDWMEKRTCCDRFCHICIIISVLYVQMEAKL